MRFERLLWMALAMFLVGGGRWDRDPLVERVNGNPEYRDDVSGTPEYQAADGGSTIPPPDAP